MEDGGQQTGGWRSEKQEAQGEQKHFRYFVVNLNNKSSYYAVTVLKDRVFRLTIITLKGARPRNNWSKTQTFLPPEKNIMDK